MMALRGLRASSTLLQRPRFVQFQYRSLATISRETDFKIPLIDFKPFLIGGENEKRKCALDILEGFTTSGFIYIKNAGIPPSSASNAFEWSKRFFELPAEEKLKLAWETPESNRGYVAPGREKVSRLLSHEEIEKIRTAAPDLKESLEIGKEPSDNYQVMSEEDDVLIV
jgi:isopenicillin N synthase-like dioxygenase